jgi:crotonobetainyl-CoA:carnitine CoA-transferase CaiB-like acyl-CoA transferase
MKHPLEGLRVVDFGIMFAGPYAAKMLADYGADVVKVEATGGDPMRRSPKNFNGGQRNKRSIAIDLKHPEGLALAHKLIAGADVMCHNMRPGTAEKLGIDYETARRLRPDIIYLHSPGFGNAGPRKLEPAFEPLVSGMVGIEVNCGGEGADMPGRTLANMDTGNGLLGASAILMALLHRKRTGEGQFVESPLMNSGMVHSSETYFLPNGELAPRRRLDRNVQGYEALDRVYQTREDWICIVVDSDARFAALCRVLGLAALAQDARFATRESRRANDKALIAALEPKFREKPAVEWRAALQGADVPCEVPTVDGERALFGTQEDLRSGAEENLRSGAVADYPHPTHGRSLEIGLGIRLSETPGVLRRAPPLIGQHSREVLAELGLSEAAMRDLKDRKVVTWPEG